MVKRVHLTKERRSFTDRRNILSWRLLVYVFTNENKNNEFQTLFIHKKLLCILQSVMIIVLSVSISKR